jgi:hypothetical protein
MPESRDAPHANSAPAPGPEIQHLDALVGRCRSEGDIVGRFLSRSAAPPSTSGFPGASSSSTTSPSGSSRSRRLS